MTTQPSSALSTLLRRNEQAIQQPAQQPEPLARPMLFTFMSVQINMGGGGGNNINAPQPVRRMPPRIEEMDDDGDVRMNETDNNAVADNNNDNPLVANNSNASEGDDDDDDEMSEDDEEEGDIDERGITGTAMGRHRAQIDRTERRRIKSMRKLTEATSVTVTASLIDERHCPRDTEHFLSIYARDKQWALRFLDGYLKHFASIPWPTSDNENDKQLDQIETIIELADVLPDTLETIKTSLELLGGSLWTYYTQTLHGKNAPRVDKRFWWLVYAQLKKVIYHHSPCHATFRDTWYGKTTIGQLLELPYADVLEYLQWAHAHGWCSYGNLSPSTSMDLLGSNDDDDWTASFVKGEDLQRLLQPAINKTPQEVDSSFQPSKIKDIAAPQWLGLSVGNLTIYELHNFMHRLHGNTNRLSWTPQTELLVLLLCYHADRFSLGLNAPRLYDSLGCFFWRKDAEQGDKKVGTDFFVDVTSHMFIRHLTAIHAFHALMSPVRRNTDYSIHEEKRTHVPLQVCDDYNTIFDKNSFLPLTEELADLETRFKDAHQLTSYVILPGRTIDKFAVQEMHIKTMQTTVLVSGDTTHLSETSIATRLNPMTVLTKVRPEQRAVVSNLALPFGAAEMIFAAGRPGGKWPSGREDLNLFGAQAMTASIYSVFRVTEPLLKMSTSAMNHKNERTRESIRQVFRNDKLSLAAIVKNDHAQLYDLLRARDADNSPTSATSNAARHISLEEWWLLIVDTHPHLPFVYPHCLRTVSNSPVPVLITFRGEHCVSDIRRHFFFGRTNQVVKGLRMWCCATAFLLPDAYQGLVHPLLLIIFGKSMAVYAQAGQKVKGILNRKEDRADVRAKPSMLFDRNNVKTESRSIVKQTKR